MTIISKDVNNDKNIWMLYSMLPVDSKKRINTVIKKELTSVLGAVGLRVLTNDMEVQNEPKKTEPKKIEKKKLRRKTWDVHGRRFPSAKKLCDFYGIKISYLRYKIYVQGEELEDFLPEKKDTSEVLRRRSDSQGNLSYVLN